MSPQLQRGVVMASSQRAIRLDPLFSSRFFEASDEKEMEVPIPFPLPASPTDLPRFLDDSAQGNEYKANFGKVVDELAAWANMQRLNTAVCNEFKNTYLDYTGSNEEENVTLFHMYHEGIATLAAIVVELHNESIPLKSRVSVIQNLLLGLLECGPGTYTNISKAYAELRSFTKSSVYWMTVRENIAKDKVLEIIREFDPEELEDLDLERMEIHYVNAVLNTFSKELGINPIQDDNLTCCNPEFLKILTESFAGCFPELLSLKAVCSAALIQLDADQLDANINTRPTESLEEFEMALARQGAQSEELPFYSPHDMVVVSDTDGSVSIAWNTYYILFLSIYSRLLRKGFINTLTLSGYPLGNNSTMVYLPNTSLQFAYVCQGEAITPFLSFCAEKLMSTDSNVTAKIWSFVTQQEQSDEAHFDILMALSFYFYSSACTVPNSLARLNDLLLHSISAVRHFLAKEVWQLLIAFEGDQRILCLDSLEGELDEVADCFDGIEEMLGLFDTKDAWRVLKKISYDKREEELTFNRLRALLHHSPRDKANAILIQHAPTFNFLMLMLMAFPLTEWRQHVSELPLDRIFSLFCQFSRLPGLLISFNKEQLETFTELFEAKLLPTLLEFIIDELTEETDINHAEKIQAFVTLQKRMEGVPYAECFCQWLLEHAGIISRNPTTTSIFTHPNKAKEFLQTLVNVFTTCHKNIDQLKPT